MSKNKKEKSEDKTTIIRDRILAARKNTKERHIKVKQWNKYWNGTAKPSSIKPMDYIFVNYCFAVIKNKIARLYYRNPFINVKPVNPNNEKAVMAAEKAEPVVNKQMNDRKFGIRSQIKKSLMDWQRTGLGAFFVGWETELEEDKEEVKSINSDQPDFRRIHPLKIHLPSNFTPEKIPYVVIEVDSSLDDLKNNKNYNQEVLGRLRPASISYTKTGDKSSSESNDLARVKTFHYYDEKEMAVYVQSEEDPIIAPKANPYLKVFGAERAIPVRFIWGDDDLETEWPMSTIQIMEKLQMELNKTRTQKSIHRKRFNRKYLYDKTLGNDDVTKVEEGQDGIMIGVNVEGNKNLSNMVVPISDANQTMANDEMDRLTKDDINVITGISQVGLSGKSVNQTLGQDQIGESRSQSREDEEQEMVEEFVEEIYAALLQLDQAKLQTAIAVKINGEKTQEWQEVTGDDIQGEMLLTVVSGSMVRETDDQVRKEAGAVSAHIATVPTLQKLLPDVAASILDTYPQFSSIAEKAKEIIKQNEKNPPPPPPPPASAPAQVLVAIADLIKGGVQVSINQIEAALQMAGLPPSTPPPPLPPQGQPDMPLVPPQEIPMKPSMESPMPPQGLPQGLPQ